MLLFVLVLILLQIPGIQTNVSKLLTNYITENTGYRTAIENVNIRWWDALSLKNVKIYDLNDSLMVNLEEVYVDFSVSGLLDKESPGFDEVRLKRGLVRILTHEQADAPNISTFLARISGMTRSDDPSSERGPPKFDIDKIYFEQTSLDIINYKIDAIERGFDYSRLRFRDMRADADLFFIRADTIGFRLHSMVGIESTSGIPIEQLRTDFTYSRKGMEFNHLYLKSDETEIKNYLSFAYDNIDALDDFNNKVDVLARLDEAVLDIQDLRFFSENFPDIDDKAYLSGEVRGKISDFFSDELLVKFGKRSALFGKFNVRCLSDVDQTLFQLSLMNSTLTNEDLAPYISEEGQKEVNKFREVRFDADFSGSLTDFTAAGAFRTRIGRINGHLNYKSINDLPTYNGEIELVDLDLGVLMEDNETFQKTSLKGRINGTGLSVGTALLELQADVRHIGILDYDYTGITTNATFGKDLFNGMLSIDDPNLKMVLNGTLDLRNNKDSVRLEAKLDTAFLHELNLIENEGFISGDFQLDTKGVTIDEIEGAARFNNVVVSYEGRNLAVDHFLFQSLFADDTRLISLNSDLLVAGISGNFKVAEVARDVKKLWQDYYGIITSTGDIA